MSTELAITLPPTQDELPFDDGEPMDSHQHRLQQELLTQTLEEELSDREDVYIGGNLGIYFSLLQAQAAMRGTQQFRAPDVFVVTQTRRGPRRSWVVWEEGATPDLVIELLSPSTATKDRGEKKRVYARQLKVPEYYLFDPDTGEFEAFRLELTTGSYVPAPRTPEGDCVSDVLGLRLGCWKGTYMNTESTWLRWKRPDGSLIPTSGERAEAERQKAEAERQRADALAERLAQLEQQLRAAGIEPG